MHQRAETTILPFTNTRLLFPSPRRTASNAHHQPQPRPHQPDDVDVHGGRLVSSSLRLLSSAFSHLADGIRVAGDTTAGVSGTGIKLIGGGVKSLGGSLERTVDSRMEVSWGGEDRNTRRAENKALLLVYLQTALISLLVVSSTVSI